MTAAASGRALASWAPRDGLPYPLGVTWITEEAAWNLAVCLHGEADPAKPVLKQGLDQLRNRSGPVWHCRIPMMGMNGARFYACQVDGPREPYHGFDRDEILFDPYARAFRFPPGSDRKAAIGPGANAGGAPLGLIAADVEPFDRGDDRRPRHESDVVIVPIVEPSGPCDRRSAQSTHREAPGRQPRSPRPEWVP